MKSTGSWSLHATLIGLVAILAWDASRLDLVVAHAMWGPRGFPLQADAQVKVWLHAAPRLALALIIMWLLVGVRWPTGIQRELSVSERAFWAAATVCALALVLAAKQISGTSCPSDLDEFGGRFHWVSHWDWRAHDGGPGHCFPGGHASVGFALFPAWFALRTRCPRCAQAWLLAAVITGTFLGVVQQLRGAHLTSDTLWSAWLCWVAALVGDWLRHRTGLRPSSHKQASNRLPAQ